MVLSHSSCVDDKLVKSLKAIDLTEGRNEIGVQLLNEVENRTPAWLFSFR